MFSRHRLQRLTSITFLFNLLERHFKCSQTLSVSSDGSRPSSGVFSPERRLPIRRQNCLMGLQIIPGSSHDVRSDIVRLRFE